MALVSLGFVSGMFASAVVVWWFSAWTYMPALAFGGIVAGYFTVIRWHKRKNFIMPFVKAAAFLAFAYGAYYISLRDASWLLGTNGFAAFSDYKAASAGPALFVASFVGSCAGALIICVALRLFYLRYDFVRGFLLFTLCSAAIGSIIAVGYETFGFLPQLLFPLWNTAIAGMVEYLRKKSALEEAEASGRDSSGTLAAASAATA